MRMRKYSMTGQRVAQLKRLLRNDKIQVKRIDVAAHEKKADSVYVFFDRVAEETGKDRETLKRLKAAAKKVVNDKVYVKLSNAKQRELFLLDRYGLTKRDIADVVELVKMIEIGVEMGESKKEEEEPEPAYINGHYVFRAPGTRKYRNEDGSISPTLRFL